jgi:hypothetical protein
VGGGGEIAGKRRKAPLGEVGRRCLELAAANSTAAHIGLIKLKSSGNLGTHVYPELGAKRVEAGRCEHAESCTSMRTTKSAQGSTLYLSVGVFLTLLV